VAQNAQVSTHRTHSTKGYDGSAAEKLSGDRQRERRSYGRVRTIIARSEYQA
jgi:hypothetical protein